MSLAGAVSRLEARNDLLERRLRELEGAQDPERRVIRDLRKRVIELEALLELREDDPSPAAPDWFHKLPGQQRALLRCFSEAYPRFIHRDVAETLLPNPMGVIRQPSSIIPVLVSKIRKQLGYEAIENSFGAGYRCSANIAQALGKVTNTMKRDMPLDVYLNSQ